MTRAEQTCTVVRKWLIKAENDLKNATYTLTMEDDCPTDTVCVHAQQCAEKYNKAMLVWKSRPFSKTQNLARLIAFRMHSRA